MFHLISARSLTLILYYCCFIYITYIIIIIYMIIYIIIYIMIINELYMMNRKYHYVFR